MVDGIGTACGAGNGYAPYQSSGRQASTTTITVATQLQTATAQIEQAGQQATLAYASYSESVTIDIQSGGSGAGATPGNTVAGQAQEGQQALATVEQTAAEAHDFLKNDAKQKLQIALNELKLLKLLGSTPAGAKEAAQLARQIAQAATEYAQGGGAGPSGNANAAAAAPAAVEAGAATTPSQAAGAGAPATGSGLADAATAAQQDPFYQEVQAAIAELRKYLRKTLPALELSSDKKTRELGRKVEKSFDASVAQIAQAEAQFNAVSSGSSADQAALGGSGSAASAAAALVAGSYQQINISA